MIFLILHRHLNFIGVLWSCSNNDRLPACSSEKFVRIRNNFGYLSNSVVETYKYGSVECPWRIEMSRGQRINLTLIDFSTPTTDLVSSESGSMHSRGTCFQYAILTERSSTTRNVRICGGERRERNVYTSRTNSVDIRFITKVDVETDKEYFFLLRYEGSIQVHCITRVCVHAVKCGWPHVSKQEHMRLIRLHIAYTS